MKSDPYKRLIDGMVVLAQRSISAGRVFKFGHPVRPDVSDAQLSDEERKLKAIFARLNDQDRQVLGRALLTERESGLHDFAAFLQEATSKGKMNIKWDGETFTLPRSSTMQEDFIRRLSGKDWEKR
jgi:hypothetical protein